MRPRGLARKWRTRVLQSQTWPIGLPGRRNRYGAVIRHIDASATTVINQTLQLREVLHTKATNKATSAPSTSSSLKRKVAHRVRAKVCPCKCHELAARRREGGRSSQSRHHRSRVTARFQTRTKNKHVRHRPYQTLSGGMKVNRKGKGAKGGEHNQGSGNKVLETIRCTGDRSRRKRKVMKLI